MKMFNLIRGRHQKVSIQDSTDIDSSISVGNSENSNLS